jgi:hypothetical protein
MCIRWNKTAIKVHCLVELEISGIQDVRSKHKIGSTILKEWTTPYFRNTTSTTNLEEEQIVDALVNDGNASMLEQVSRPNTWRKMMMMMMIIKILMRHFHYAGKCTCGTPKRRPRKPNDSASEKHSINV